MCAATVTDSARIAAALCIALAAADSAAPQAPEWVQVLPAGPKISGLDGRAYRLDRPAEVASASLIEGRPFPIDWEHATVIKASEGEEAPAAGWIVALEARDGAVWGRVEWTPRGARSVGDREYRYLSPEIGYDKTTRQIVRLLSVGLTNRPNLIMQSLNREDTAEETHRMAIIKTVWAALGLDGDATEAQAVTAIETLKSERQTALNGAESPPLDKFVPRSDYDTALNRATEAETKLAAAGKAAQDAEIQTALDGALAAGKITPATVDYHREQCRAEGGLERFKTFVEAAPAVGAPSGLDGRRPETELNREEAGDAAKIAGMFGHTKADLDKVRV